MPLKGAVIKDGASAMTPTGGSDMTFNEDGQPVVGGVHLANTAQTDFRIRENMTVKQKVPTISASGVYSKDKKSITYVEPKILASGVTVFNLIRIEREVHPESSAAEALNLNMVGAQLLSDSDFANFWAAGSLA
jgi:hypothetical protein